MPDKPDTWAIALAWLSQHSPILYAAALSKSFQSASSDTSILTMRNLTTNSRPILVAPANGRNGSIPNGGGWLLVDWRLSRSAVIDPCETSIHGPPV